MAYWLIKTEPHKWSWDDQVKKRTTHWDGVRNYQASNNLKAMKVGDKALFYHSGEERRIMGIVKVARLYYPDPSDETGRFGMVDVTVDQPLKTPVTLAEIKANEKLATIPLVRQSRLSVMPIDDKSWALLLKMGGAEKA
jgi:predicted RNA-binding protein with PUA-like domain